MERRDSAYAFRSPFIVALPAAKDAEEENSLTAKDAKDAKEFKNNN